MENSTSQYLTSMDHALCITFWVIAVVSFVLNLLFAIVIARKPSMLKRPHNILLFSLAITDMLTGEFMAILLCFAVMVLLTISIATFTSVFLNYSLLSL